MSDPLAEIKQLYFRATRATIARDFDRAIDLLKSLPTEDDRERATVYMQGLAEMKKQWAGKAGPGSPASDVRGPKSKVRSATSGVRSAKFVPTSGVRGAKSGVRSAVSVSGVQRSGSSSRRPK